MSTCTECLNLEAQLERAALEYLRLIHDPDDPSAKIAKQNKDEAQTRFNEHKRTAHGVAFGSGA